MAEPQGIVGQNAGRSESGAVAERPTLDVFISYRRGPDGDEDAAARLGGDLAARFGADHVFLDVRQLHDGDDYVEAIDESIAQCDVLIALVGPRWKEILDERARQTLEEWRKDFVRLEIEAALKRWPAIRIVPVHIGGAKMLIDTELPPTLAKLGRLHARELRHADWDRDVLDLIDQLERPAPRSARDVDSGDRATVSTSRRFQRPSPEYPVDERHLQEVAAKLVQRQPIVPVLGPGVNAVGPAEASDEDGEYLTDADELARRLAKRFGYPVDRTTRLAAVSEYARWMEGVPPLYETLADALRSQPPTSVHRFFAELPRTLRDRGVRRPYQMIITTNYDNALERAFQEANEYYDLAVYMGSGEHAGRFVHVPYDVGQAVPVPNPSDYSGFPISPENRELQRTVIVKVHGSVPDQALPEATEDCVLTEDNYIDYLSLNPVNSVVPFSILNQLKSHVLFLGYNIRDWSLRVLLQRIWRGQHSRSWAVQRERLTELDDLLWREGFGLKQVYSASLAEYVQALQTEVEAAAELHVA